MSLTTGRGPLSANPAGHFDRPVPAGVVYVEPFLRRVRATIGQRTVVDSERVVLVHRAGQPPAYAFPEHDVREIPAAAEPAARGYVRVPWDAVTAWYEEDEQVFGHPRNPYHRIDCVRARRQLRVEAASAVLVDTTDVIGVYETARSPQLYVRRDVVRMDLLVASPTVTYCPYKGTASYWTAHAAGSVVQDVAWSYDAPLPECGPIAGMLSFDPARVTLVQSVPSWFEPPPTAAADGDNRGRSHA
jgi:uncharacterized protein (DUF427 family)